MFEYAAKTYKTEIAIYRLNYAVDLRYGVLSDIAHNILTEEPISIVTPSFNCIWQGDAMKQLYAAYCMRVLMYLN
jgi:hypothetical protein